MGYAFGEGDDAAERLGLLHQVFEPTSRRFLEGAAPREPDLAVDLGCGPGHTTRLLAETVAAHHTVGIDASEDFIGRARQQRVPGVEFRVADLLVEDPPVADVVYARYLLAHLPEPEEQAARWRSRLRAGGRLLLEENGTIEATDPVLARYEELVSTMIAEDGGDLYVGRRLADLAPRDGGSVRRDHLQPPIGQVARLFGRNLRTWGPRAVGSGLADVDTVDRLARDLQDMEGREDIGPARWELVQVVLPPA